MCGVRKRATGVARRRYLRQTEPNQTEPNQSSFSVPAFCSEGLLSCPARALGVVQHEGIVAPVGSVFHGANTNKISSCKLATQSVASAVFAPRYGVHIDACGSDCSLALLSYSNLHRASPDPRHVFDRPALLFVFFLPGPRRHPSAVQGFV